MNKKIMVTDGMKEAETQAAWHEGRQSILMEIEEQRHVMLDERRKTQQERQAMLGDTNDARREGGDAGQNQLVCWCCFGAFPAIMHIVIRMIIVLVVSIG